MSERDIYDPEFDEWLPARGHDGYYVSASGRVVGPGKHGKPKLIKPTSLPSGHQYVSLYGPDGKRKEYVHRLVADAFVHNPDNHNLVRHLNGYPDDNNASNLAWGTQKDNIQDSIKMRTFRYFTDDDRKKAMDIRRTPVVAKNLDTEDELKFESQMAASRELGVHQSVISNILMGKRDHSNRWTFEYAEVKHEHN